MSATKGKAVTDDNIYQKKAHTHRFHSGVSFLAHFPGTDLLAALGHLSNSPGGKED